MPLPKPEPGLAICYSYLWHQEFAEGRDEGRKSRPCAIVLAARDADGDLLVLVAPVTHQKPADPHAVELPAEVKRHLGLDGQRSWIVTDQVNEFVWPGYDLRPISGAKHRRYHWGFLPTEIFQRVKDGIRANHRAGRARRVRRS